MMRWECDLAFATPFRARLKGSPRRTCELNMSWQPAFDPKPGDTLACDAIDMVIVPRARDHGGGWTDSLAVTSAARPSSA
jgi:hypothetical protein